MKFWAPISCLYSCNVYAGIWQPLIGCIYSHIVYAGIWCFICLPLIQPYCICGDVPPMWQHARKCAEQRLRARSPTQWSSGPTCQRCGNAQLSATATPHHPPPQLQATTCPCHLIRSPSNSARILGMDHTTDLQRIRALLRLTAYYMQQWGLCRARAGILKAVDNVDEVEDNGGSVCHNK